MIEFGQTLRAAREAKGYTISQIAEATHMLSTIVQNLEEENFSKIVAPIYGRGFVKLYCEAVGLDPKPLIDLFMEIYTGKRNLVIKERPAPPPPVTMSEDDIPPPPMTAPEYDIPPPPPPAPELPPRMAPPRYQSPQPPPEPVVREPVVMEPPPVYSTPRRTTAARVEPQVAESDSLFGNFDESAPVAAPAPAATPLRRPPTQPTEDAPAKKPGFSRYASPIREDKHIPIPSVSLPPNFWRVLFLGVVLLAILAAIGYGVRALYRATTDFSEPAPQQPVAEVAAPQPAAKPTPAPQPAAKPRPQPNDKVSDGRAPQKIPSLFFD